MSSTQVAVLGPLARDPAPVRRASQADERPLIRLIAFAALGLFGVLRWATLMNPAPTWRLLGLLAVAVALAGLAPMVIERERSVAARAGRPEALSTLGGPLALLAIVAAFPIAGVPLAWVVHLRIAVAADGIGQGLSALPGILVPYTGINEWVRVAMLLGAAILLLDAAMLLAFAPRALGDVRRAGAALPLIALVVVPAVSLHPRLAYLQGLVLFGLLAFFMWGERVPVDRRGGVVLACLATGAVGMIFAPALDQHSPWINTQALARGLTPGRAERFDWTQRYGVLNWPQTGNVVLDVKASPNAWGGEYWKTENLDNFDGRGWVTANAPTATLPSPSPKTLARWTQNLTVTIRAMQTSDVVAAGTALQQPDHLPGPALPGASVGTYTSEAVIQSGDTYTVQVYVPHPSAENLARAGGDYPFEALQGDLRLTLPQIAPGARAQTILFPPFSPHGTRPPFFDEANGPDHISAATAIKNSVYAPAYILAQQLASGARTPYAYVENVLAYLGSSRYQYDQYPPASRYPLRTFLFQSPIGYCQQFAGAMALLLRIGGIPARVATGFTTGAYDSATHQWLVSDIDAHAWVEAWFPHYGWVTFDPTPAAAPARGGRAPINSSGFLGGAGGLSKLGGRNVGTPGTVGVARTHRQGGGSAAPILLGTLGVLLGLLTLVVVAWRRSGLEDADALLAELERALSRSGRPISTGVTLAALEQRFRSSPDAAAYIRALRMARFAGEGAAPTLRQRRALRAQLRAGLGVWGAVRALWALPPRPRRARARG